MTNTLTDEEIEELESLHERDKMTVVYRRDDGDYDKDELFKKLIAAAKREKKFRLRVTLGNFSEVVAKSLNLYPNEVNLNAIKETTLKLSSLVLLRYWLYSLIN